MTPLPSQEIDHSPPEVIAWLLDSDPAIRWQVLHDLLNAPADEVAAERAKVASQGWGVCDLQRAILFRNEALNYCLRQEPDIDFAILVPWEGLGVQL